MIPEEVRKRWIQVAQFLQQQGLEFIKAQPPITNEDALRLIHVGRLIERATVEGRSGDACESMFDRGALDDAVDHHDGGIPIPLPRDVAERLKRRGFDLTGIPIEGQTDEAS